MVDDCYYRLYTNIGRTQRYTMALDTCEEDIIIIERISSYSVIRKYIPFQ